MEAADNARPCSKHVLQYIIQQDSYAKHMQMLVHDNAHDTVLQYLKYSSECNTADSWIQAPQPTLRVEVYFMQVGLGLYTRRERF